MKVTKTSTYIIEMSESEAKEYVVAVLRAGWVTPDDNPLNTLGKHLSDEINTGTKSPRGIGQMYPRRNNEESKNR